MVRAAIGTSFITLLAVLSAPPPLDPGRAGQTPGTSSRVVQARLQSNILGQERELIIHLPGGHGHEKRYPVLYVLDGSSQDQPLADKLESLFAEGLVPPTIVVGIPNMSARNRYRRAWSCIQPAWKAASWRLSEKTSNRFRSARWIMLCASTCTSATATARTARAGSRKRPNCA